MTWDSETRHRLEQLRQIPLVEVLRAMGAKPDRCDHNKWHTEQGPISIQGLQFMNWKQNRGGGGAIDLVMHLKGMDFLSAIAWLGGRHPWREHPPEPVR